VTIALSSGGLDTGACHNTINGQNITSEHHTSTPVVVNWQQPQYAFVRHSCWGMSHVGALCAQCHSFHPARRSLPEACRIHRALIPHMHLLYAYCKSQLFI
jgi:hypothetical protein